MQQQANIQPLMVSLKEAALMLNVDPTAIEGMIKRGEIYSARIGRKIMVNRNAILTLAGESAAETK